MPFKSSCFYHGCRKYIRLAALLHLIVVPRWSATTQALEFCGSQQGGGVCPTGNTCCPFSTASSPSVANRTLKTSSSACIPNDLGSHNATCCHDDKIAKVFDRTKLFTGSGTTTTKSGCPVGYACTTHSDDNPDRTEGTQFCLANDSFVNIDPLLPVLPRYPIYPCPQIKHIYGFSSHNVSNTKKLAYYSSHGDIQKSMASSTTLNWKSSIRHVVIMIHGANRNADDYFCSLHAIAQHQQMNPSEILLLVPWFVSTSDSPVIPLVNGGEPYRWDTSRDVSGPWRYGANAVSSSTSFETSSFALLDGIVSYVLGTAIRPQFPNLQRLVVAGHSSGGQFVQRWSMLTPTWDDERMKSIVANPSSYAYLTPMRHIDTEWRLPNSDELRLCPDYNEWEWGIGTALFQQHPMPTKPYRSCIDTVPPYVQNALSRYGTVLNLTSIFSIRNISYLVGGLDVCNIPNTKKPNGWCNSHGLETSCRDMMQGSNRLERHYWYCASLQILNISHDCFVVPGVGHDHSFMYSSEIGVASIFGRPEYSIATMA